MKIRCYCGALIVDAAENSPQKGHLVPDETWHGLLESLERDVVDAVCDKRLEREAAYHRLAEIVIRAARPVWQCRDCGRVYFDVRRPETVAFQPEDQGLTRAVLAARV